MTTATKTDHATLTSRLAKVWSADKFRGVMVPGAGSYTAYEIGRAMANDQESMAAMRNALEIIAGKKQCVDGLMSNSDVALAALASA